MAPNNAVLSGAQAAAHPLLKPNQHQHTHPPSDKLNLASFTTTANAALARAQAVLANITAQLDANQFGQLAKDRCSVQDIKKEIDQLYDSPEVHTELERLQVRRVEPTKRATFHPTFSRATPEPASGSNTPRPTATRAAGETVPTRENTVDSESEIGGTRLIEDAVKRLTEEAANSPLAIIGEAREGYSAFIRKPKRYETNSIVKLRNTPNPSTPDAPPPHSGSSQSPVSSLVFTVTFHSIPRKPSKRTPTFSVPTQTIHLRGSNTLGDVRRALKLACDWIPAEVDDGQTDAEDDNSDGDSDTTNAEEDEGSSSDDDQSEERQTRWKAEKRVSGCVFAAGGVLYADGDEGKTDYAEMIQKQLERAEVIADSRKRRRSPSVSSDAEDSFAGDSSSRAADRSTYTIGPSIDKAKIGTLQGLRLGEACWFMHQGNCEHIWTIDSVRYAHPNDPPLEDPLSPTCTAPYPITSFLSVVPQAQCRLCDRDPGEVVTRDDDLAGEAVALLCATCFKLLHGGWGEGGPESGTARDGTRAVVTLIEE